MNFVTLPKLKNGDKVAILSPSFAAPAVWPHVYKLGCQRLRDVFGLEPIEFPTTRKLGASGEERIKDLVDAFESKDIKAVIASLGGDDQITYIKKLPREPFINNPKPFFGYSDNTHFINHLWLNGIPSFYGGCLFTEFAMQVKMDEFTVDYLNHAFFDNGFFDLKSSPTFNDIGLNWNDPSTINTRRKHQQNPFWSWDSLNNSQGITWGGCVESIDDMLRHGATIPNLNDFKNIVLFLETSEEIPDHFYFRRVLRALGERGILSNVQGLLIGRPKAWEFNKQKTDKEKIIYKKAQQEMVLEVTRKYNEDIPIIQNIDIGHTAPQIPLPVGKKIKIDSSTKSIQMEF
ncbi:MAG: Peptidase U61 LD-carboxypeptidase A [Candidatus Shapirobacteria bacterium GW2011_GWE1_38_10]|uniref:Peptidase U61 LD-carboxypeptidase A n=1 Tax=Candidatus Shapirobacteria bacterium GW2011_GWE1_38_10 TaxID=1618488 RepID=A0A0G0I6V1_9BACT|nr:MAG: Peptidase U61 LD-carboxypeptidase A [Candidatus Shapirobacteria bacterium GW2011_GWF2_37_20]KKQ50267.1 MAG: Peptidase U61 LD-carboxypeptidase A [Candidatus Shapirobacteria bacterium GW2011_GWE1_38_10]KKQ64801.1 MAG: Peptidase U61 LD-carboxypeptidase A [Candidatus Shapirobacteria bacterium GW2011_GWF1_38_23]HBP51328.1 LD-carboxypeptidase [Candidatus Shapirobacteria bacterium]